MPDFNPWAGVPLPNNPSAMADPNVLTATPSLVPSLPAPANWPAPAPAPAPAPSLFPVFPAPVDITPLPTPAVPPVPIQGVDPTTDFAPVPTPTRPAPGSSGSSLGRMQAETGAAFQDEAKAAANEGEVAGQGQANEAANYEAQAQAHAKQAQDLADRQAFVRAKQQQLDADTATQLQKARDYTIPDFWAGREGQFAGSAIAVGLTALGQGLLGSSVNPTLDAINHNVDAYFNREKDKVSNLYRYAEQKGMLNEQTKKQYAEQLTDLLAQHSIVNNELADHALKVAAESGSQDAVAKAQTLAAKLREQGSQSGLMFYDARSKRIEADAAATKAAAEVARARGEAQQQKELAPVRADLKHETDRLMGSDRSPGVLRQQQAAGALGDAVRKAYASGDTQAIQAALIAAKESGTRLNAGVAPTKQTLELFNDLTGTPQEIAAKVSKLMGDPKAAEQKVKGVIDYLDDIEDRKTTELDTHHKRLTDKFLGKTANYTPLQKQEAYNQLQSVFEGVTNRDAQRSPRYRDTSYGPVNTNPGLRPVVVNGVRGYLPTGSNNVADFKPAQ